MTSIGETLRRERQRRGVSLEQISGQTKISAHLLEALEADQFERLPGGVFAKNFVRQYARVLELDEDELVAELKDYLEPAPAVIETPIQPVRPRVKKFAPNSRAFEDFRDRIRSDSSISAFLWVVIAVIACAGVYTMWQRGRQTTKSVETTRPAQPAPASVAQPASLKKDTDTNTSLPAAPGFRPAELSATGKVQSQTAALAPPAARTPGAVKLASSVKVQAQKPEAGIAAKQTPKPTAALSAQPNGPHVQPAPTQTQAARTFHVALTANQEVWLRISADGQHVYSGTLTPQESKQLEAARKIRVLVGNAAGLNITLNGKPLGPLGPQGEIQMWELTSNGAHVVPRTPPTSEGPSAGEERP
ncbi:MAG: hypothetical protein DMG57_14800 [Acidobacteria bacterium]|nr:MAG: hypothetical protein DMG57_14800 [Acidobacteriota bacterium]